MKSQWPAKKCCVCKEQTDRLCDGDVGSGRTCDKGICKKHAHHEEPDRDYCPKHTTRKCQEGQPLKVGSIVILGTQTKTLTCKVTKITKGKITVKPVASK